VLRNALIAATVALTAISGVLHYATDQPVATFILCALALAGLAWMVAVGTESVGARFGPAATGVLQSTLGSLFANALLVLGLSLVAGATVAEGRCMTFGKHLPNDTAVLTLLAVFTIVVLGVSDRVGDRASHHTVEISVIGAVVLLAIYASWLPGYLRSDEVVGIAEDEIAGRLPFGTALALLAAAGVGAALVSDWFIAALDPAIASLGISKPFTGLVIVGIAGNAVENVVGITLAAKGKSDLALTVIKNSVSQIAVLLYPTLVLASLFFSHRLTFVVNPVLTGALALTALAVWGITGDGKAAAFEGWALVGFYVILAALTWYE
jgi:Ca2+:H+ antiporter